MQLVLFVTIFDFIVLLTKMINSAETLIIIGARSEGDVATYKLARQE